MESITKENFYIITGAPGVGKSTLVSYLGDTYQTEIEPARKIIAEQRAINGDGLWEKDREKFIGLLLESSIDQFLKNKSSDLIFFDRGIPDNFAYAKYGGLKTENIKPAAKKYFYNRKVFLLSPWEDIYTTDDERNMNFSEVELFHQHIVTSYEEMGYELVDIPNVSVEKRAKFIIDAVAK